MSRTNAVSTQNNFTKGLITEATGLTFPENACTDTNNCIFDWTGTVKRRYPLDVEANHVVDTIADATSVYNTYVWKDVAGDGNIIFVIVQIGRYIYAYRSELGAATSTGKYGAIVADLMNYVPAGITEAIVKVSECQFATGNGILFVTHPNVNSFYIEYNISANTFSTTGITLEIRDTDGDVTDPTTDSVRPITNLAGTPNSHYYNLLNQGWTSTTLSQWDSARSDMPSNCDVSWYFKNAENQFDFSKADDTAIGNSTAPKGHFIYNVYNVNRSANEIGAVDYVISTARVSCCAFFAGRVFYSGLASQGQNSKIYFSQIIQNDTQYGKCYQANDPTSEQLFDLLTTDGGVINILDAGTIIKMFPALNALIVFATNGVWAITGSQGIGFAANDYSVNKISSIQNLTASSFVDVEGIPFWWNLDGIYTIQTDSSGRFVAVSVTDTNIKTFFKNIPTGSKNLARGVYDPRGKVVQWIYRSTTADIFGDNYVFDSILNYNLLTKAFYPWSVDVSTYKINSIVYTIGASGAYDAQLVEDGGSFVVDDGNQVVAYITDDPTSGYIVKYLTTLPGNNVTWSDFKTNLVSNFTDWKTINGTGIDYSSYFVTGYAVHGQGVRKFQSNYVTLFPENLVDSSFYIFSKWDYAISGNTGRWSSKQFLRMLADKFTYKPKRVRLRGNGLVCQFKIESNSTDPFFLAGWSTFETGNQWI